MFEFRTKIENTAPRVKDAVGKAAFRNFGHAAASIRKDAQASITRSTQVTKATYDYSGIKRNASGQFLAGSGKRKVVSRAHHRPSPPGSPPFTAQGLLSRAILFAADQSGAVIGPAESVAGTVGQAHEFGGDYKGNNYPERPFMYPALERGTPRFAGEWAGSIAQ
jgi:phage gpG-like protein